VYSRIFFGFGVSGSRHMVSGVKLFDVLKMGDPLSHIADDAYVARERERVFLRLESRCIHPLSP
jgi:hypothetical protein